MKTINRNSKIVISLLMVLVMLFSTVAVTAFANTEDGNDTQEVIATAPTVSDTDWYTFTYIPPMEGANAKLDVQIKADASEYWNIGQEDILVLVTDVLTIAVQYAMDTKLGSYVDLEDLGFELLDASYDFSSLPAGVKDMLKDYAKEVLGVDSLADLEKNLTVDEENGITEQYVKDYKEEIQANIDGFIKEVESTGGGVAAVIGAALQASGATEEEISKVVETVKEVVVDPTTATESTVFTEVMEKIYGEKDAETGEIVIPEDKMNVVSNLTTTITNTVEDAANSTFSPIDILKMFKSVSIDEADIISRENGISFDYNAVISALKKIPTPGELANYSVDEYKELLAYSFGIDLIQTQG